MSANIDIIIGIQWGDEGKGRIVDLYSADYDVVARFGGGDNAGHSIHVGTTKLALRIVPSGVLQEHTELFIGGGTVVSPSGLLGELESLAKLGVDVRRVSVSDRAHVVMPYHAIADRANERARGSAALGTTGRGIGPAYADKVARVGVTFRDLMDHQHLEERLRLSPSSTARNLNTGADAIDEVESMSAALAAADRIAPHIVDGVSYIHDRISRGKAILVEGAQGTLLDIGFGTYPYVTSSHTIAGGACTGLGIGPTAIRSVIGIAKAYCTRVGAGPFPSELLDETGEALRRAGGEFGTVTGRPRRCGWFDAVAGRYATAVNGLSSVILTKLDVLSGLGRLGVATSYHRGGQAVGFGTVGNEELSIEIEWMDGWDEPLTGVRTLEELPTAARRYVARIEELLGVPVIAISVGPERSQFLKTCG